MAARVRRFPGAVCGLTVGTLRPDAGACASLAVMGTELLVPSGVVTFLFTDVEGSTLLWEQDSEAMEAALERHDEILRSAIDNFGGYVFSTAGDSFSVSFVRPADAVAVAVAAQRDLQAEPWPKGAPITVRMGVHTGSAQERGGDYFGSEVSRAARLMGIAHGDQIAVSDATASLWTTDNDVMLVDRGQHQLRDLASPIRVWQVVCEGLRSEFPALRSLGAFKHNLPTHLDELIGRDQELSELTGLIGGCRLLTVVGPGGMGKTRLAVAAGAELTANHVDGVWLIDLTTALPSPDSVAAAIGQAMGFESRVGQTWQETVAAALSVREALLIVDNCEHLLSAVAEVVERLLAAAGSVSIVATSRQRLGLAEEKLFPLGPLVAGPELFIVRARALDPSFDGTSSMTAIEEICRRLDGLPLAIELAATRIRSMQPEEIAQRLNARFRLLRRRGDTNARHQTLVATVDWSYEQLPLRTQLLFAQLGVFVGSFTHAAAAGVADDALDDLDVADVLDELVDKSLITAARAGSTTRYRLLETMSVYARDRLQDSGALAGTERARASTRVALVAEQMGRLADSSSPWQDAFFELQADVDDIEAAFYWAYEHEPDLADELFSVAYSVLADSALGLARAQDLAQAILALHDQGRCSPLVASLAAAVVGIKHLDAAEARINALLAQGEPTGGARAAGLAIKAWAEVVLRNDLEAGITLADESLEASTSIEDQRTRIFFQGLAIVQYAQANRFDLAHQAIGRYTDDWAWASTGYFSMWRHYVEGVALRGLDLDKSTTHFIKGLQVAEELHHVASRAWLGYHLAINHLADRQNEQAAEGFVAVLPALLDTNQPLAVSCAFEDLASALAHSGRPHSAVTAFAIAEKELARLQATSFDAYVKRRDRLLPRLRDQLGDDVFETARQEGHLRTLDEAVRHTSKLLDA